MPHEIIFQFPLTRYLICYFFMCDTVIPLIILNHPDLPSCNYEGGIKRIQKATDEFLLSLGYEHIPGSGTYKVINSNNERVALFAHNNFGMGFLSSVLDIPYPTVCSHFSMGHSGITVIHFEEDEDGYCSPVILTLSSDSHLYHDGLYTKYNNSIYFFSLRGYVFRIVD